MAIFDILFKIIGAAGLLCISAGVIGKKRFRQDVLYIIGGLLLLLYSAYIGDMIFIILQVIFVAAAVFDFIKIKK